MENIFNLPMIRLVQRLSIFLTLCSCIYVIFFLFTKGNEDAVLEKSSIGSTKSAALVAPSPGFDLNPSSTVANDQARDIFTLSTDVSPTGAVEKTPKGQLPNHLKIVGILIAHPSQIIIEDSLANKTYFIDEQNPQDGIKIVQVQANQMTVNYQGQDIIIPITKN